MSQQSAVVSPCYVRHKLYVHLFGVWSNRLSLSLRDVSLVTRLVL